MQENIDITLDAKAAGAYLAIEHKKEKKNNLGWKQFTIQYILMYNIFNSGRKKIILCALMQYMEMDHSAIHTYFLCQYI